MPEKKDENSKYACAHKGGYPKINVSHPQDVPHDEMHQINVDIMPEDRDRHHA